MHLVTFGFLIHVTLSEEPHASHSALCFYVGSCEVSNTALGQGEKFLTPGSFGSFSLAQGLLLPVDVTPEGGIVGDVQSGENTENT